MITLSFLSYCFSIKVKEPIEITLLAIVTLVRLLQNSNAEEPIEVQPRHKRLSRQQLQVMLKKKIKIFHWDLYALHGYLNSMHTSSTH